MICPNCGTENNDSAICVRCNYILNPNNVNTQPQMQYVNNINPQPQMQYVNNVDMQPQMQPQMQPVYYQPVYIQTKSNTGAKIAIGIFLTAFIAGIVALVLYFTGVFGNFDGSFGSSSSSTNSIIGTWTDTSGSETFTFTFNSGNSGKIVYYDSNYYLTMTMDITYTTSGNTLDITINNIDTASDFYDKSFKFDVSKYLPFSSKDMSFNYSVSGNTLTLSGDGQTQTFRRK